MPMLLKILICTIVGLLIFPSGGVLTAEPPSSAPAESLFFSIGKMVLALSITLAVLLLIFYLAKRLRLPGITPMVHGSPINILSTKYLGGKKSIWIVEIDGERLVLGLSSERISFLTKLRRSEGAI
jgi:flagellar biogenesis protein FliO